MSLSNPFNQYQQGLPVQYNCPFCYSPNCLGQCISGIVGGLQSIGKYPAQMMYLPEITPKAVDTKALKAKISSLEKVEPRKALAKSPDFVDPIVAWRAWKISPNGVLCGIGHLKEWKEREPLKAVCSMHQAIHKAPCPTDCMCGIWGYKERDPLTEEILHNYAAEIGDWCLGQVFLWGRVIEHELGFRAEFGYPKELWLLNDRDEQIGLKYNVPIRSL